MQVSLVRYCLEKDFGKFLARENDMRLQYYLVKCVANLLVTDEALCTAFC
jgi:hypothetical protein